MIASTSDLIGLLLSIEPIPVAACTGFLLVSKSCLFPAKITDFFFSLEVFD
jgi:hypothetical protein